VLADRETEDGAGGGEVEAVDGDIVGNDCLFLELEVLELVGLEDLSRLCTRSWLAVTSSNRRATKRQLTNSPELHQAERKGKKRRIQGPLLLDNKGSEDEKAGRNIDPVGHLSGKKWLGHYRHTGSTSSRDSSIT
jgi:hypothetical protein